jgi:glucose-1-phosphate adenylyltransferase
LPPSRVVGSEIRDSLLAEGSQISYASVVDSVVGVRSVIGKGSSLNQTVLLGGDFYEGEQLLMGEGQSSNEPPIGIGRDCIIERAIIDKNVRIGDKVLIRAKGRGEMLQTDRYWVRDGITVIPKGMVTPSGTAI